jgi:predicted dehydrogenase
MISTDSPILVFGAGSIGERHLGILQKLGYLNRWVYRQRNLPLRTIDSASLRIVTDLAELNGIPFAAAIICTPTAQHIPQALWCVERQIPVLIEKPLSHTLESLEALGTALAAKPTLIQVAYMLRYHPFFQKVKTLMDSEELGNLLSIQTYWGEYLPDWHPWEDYRTSYAARRELGGGVALTLSHDLDLVNWLAGSAVKTWNTLKNYRSSLEIDVESGADVSLGYENGITAHCHLNFHERVPRRWYRLVWEEGSVEIDYFKATYSLMQPGREASKYTLENFDRNQLFEDQTTDFFQKINKGSFADCSLRALDESQMILKICT